MYSYSHKVKCVSKASWKLYEIYWKVDYGRGFNKKARTFSRLTNEAGAKRFKKKWRLK